MTSMVVVAAALIIIAIDVPHLKRKRLKKELWVFSVLLLIGVGLSIAHSFQITLPNPIRGMYMIFQPLSDFLYEILT
ncbi:hypothetical protein SAMN05877753_112112 [Bacillus oleivorans]|uniref:Uncharacterized protein n=1 Tax=Bacillus oleivorans TaxID=1448271 RepID=A0A285D6N0_9BACI|nr:hypothetical protein [Bacillus oleivorans]SNX75467.1 hypothetical protein SAMN05877753_112112 [Bacillus oleivorans]